MKLCKWYIGQRYRWSPSTSSANVASATLTDNICYLPTSRDKRRASKLNILYWLSCCAMLNFILPYLPLSSRSAKGPLLLWKRAWDWRRVSEWARSQELIPFFIKSAQNFNISGRAKLEIRIMKILDISPSENPPLGPQHTHMLTYQIKWNWECLGHFIRNKDTRTGRCFLLTPANSPPYESNFISQISRFFFWSRYLQSTLFTFESGTFLISHLPPISVEEDKNTKIALKFNALHILQLHVLLSSIIQCFLSLDTYFPRFSGISWKTIKKQHWWVLTWCWRGFGAMIKV